jgi:hypothetical protein
VQHDCKFKNKFVLIALLAIKVAMFHCLIVESSTLPLRYVALLIMPSRLADSGHGRL